jgi:hypothetical protein
MRDSIAIVAPHAIIVGYTTIQSTELRSSTPTQFWGFATTLPEPYFVHKANFLQPAFFFH